MRATRTRRPSTDLLVAGAGIGGQQDLRPLELAGRLIAAAQKRRQFRTLALAQVDAVSYVHRGLLAERSSDESNRRCLSRPFAAQLHRKAGTVSRLHLRLHPHQPKTSRRSRHAAPLPSHPAIGPSDGPYPRTSRPHQTTARTTTQHPNPRRSRTPARPTIRPEGGGSVIGSRVHTRRFRRPESLRAADRLARVH